MRKFVLSFFFSLAVLSIIIFFTSSSSVANKGISSHLIIPEATQNSGITNSDSTVYTPIINTNLTATVFGYLPAWQYENARKTIRYDLLTHIAVFDFQVSPDGGLTNPEGWPWNDVITEGHKNNVKIIMTLFSTDSTEIHQVLTDSTAKRNIFSNIRESLISYKLDGVNVDFETLKYSDRNVVINSFMRDLTRFLHSEMPGMEVSFAGPAVNWGGWDFKGLAEACDYIFIMGYDYFPRSSFVSGPSASLSGNMYSVESTVQNGFFGYGEVTEAYPEKLILGVPYFGNHWITETGEPQSMNLQHVESVTFQSAMQFSGKFRTLWQSTYKVPWVRYQENGAWHQVWFDNQKSIGLKYDFAIAHGFKGVGMWALGFDGNRPELWNEIKKRFYIEPPFGLSKVASNNKNGSNNKDIFVPKALKLLESKKGKV